VKVEELMCRGVRCCLRDEDMNRAAQIMWETDCGIVPVVDGERRPVGTITDRDVCMAAYTMGGSLVSLRVGDAMAKQVFACAADATLEAAMSTMRQARVRRLPVLDESGRLAGILSLNDIAREALRQQKIARRAQLSLEVAETLAVVSEPRKSCPIETDLIARPLVGAVCQLTPAGV